MGVTPGISRPETPSGMTLLHYPVFQGALGLTQLRVAMLSGPDSLELDPAWPRMW